MYTLDTNAIIYYLANDKKSVQIIDEAIKNYSTLYISTIAIAEMTSLPTLKDDELTIIYETVKSFSVLAVDMEIARIGGLIRRIYPSIKLPDALIAATAIFTRTSLITRNVKDFQKIKELSIVAI